MKVRGLLLNRPQLHSITLLPLSRTDYVRFTRSLVLKKTSWLRGQPCETLTCVLSLKPVEQAAHHHAFENLDTVPGSCLDTQFPLSA